MFSRRLYVQMVIAIGYLLAGCAAGDKTLRSDAPGPISRAIITADVAPAATSLREDMMQPIVLQDVLTNIDALEKTFDWKPFRPGVEIARVYNSPEPGPSAAFLRYEPGASVPLHMHGGYEHIIILRGSQVDRSGEHKAGSVIINPPGSSHNVSSPNGCIVLIFWEKPVILAK